jgi:uncharacterized protein YndB with AHSA1/START domain
MSNANANADQHRACITLDRSYEATVQDLWDLWTTKEGFESWWGPQGFRVEVQEMDARVGGALAYAMIADGAEQIAFMKRAGMPLSHSVRGEFAEVTPLKRLVLRQLIDFVPGVPAYHTNACVEFFPQGKRVRMVITLDPHHDEEWTARAKMGWESQLTKVPAALAARSG